MGATWLRAATGGPASPPAWPSRTASTCAGSSWCRRSCPRLGPRAPVVDAGSAGSTRSDESGYSTEQRTPQPQTVGYGLTDSPVALAGWAGEKLLAWTDPRDPLSDEQVLDGLPVYWFTRTGASAARLYLESLGDVDRWLGGPLRAEDLVDVPTGCSVFPYELQRPTRAEAEVRFRDMRHWGERARGGHFAAWEQPQLVVDEARALRAAL